MKLNMEIAPANQVNVHLTNKILRLYFHYTEAGATTVLPPDFVVGKMRVGGSTKWQKELWESEAWAHGCLFWPYHNGQRSGKFVARLLGNPDDYIAIRTKVEAYARFVDQKGREWAHAYGVHIFSGPAHDYRAGVASAMVEATRDRWRQYEDAVSLEARLDTALAFCDEEAWNKHWTMLQEASDRYLQRRKQDLTAYEMGRNYAAQTQAD